MTLFIVVTMLQWIAGLGLLASTKTRLPKGMVLPLGLLVGLFVHSIFFFGVDLIQFGLNSTMLSATSAAIAVACNLWFSRVRSFYRWLFEKPRFTLRLYDFVVLGYAASIGFYVVWATVYWPVTPFDAMAGIDLVARETVSSGTINNRVFTDPSIVGFLSNQPFYAPFAMLLQVMFRIFGFAYGQVWLGIVAVATSWFFWSALRQFAHPMISSMLWMLLILTPEFLGYTYLLQTDYLNAAYMSVGVALLAIGATKVEYNTWWAAALMFGGACWSRTESVLLVAIGLIGCLILWNREALKPPKIKFILGAATISVFCFWLWNGMYLQWYLPTRPDTSSELVAFDVARFVAVAGSTFTNVLADTGLWGIAFVLFALGLVANLILKRNVGNLMLLVWIVAILGGLLLVGTIFSAAIVEQTLRRGMFKLLPLVFLYVAALPLVQEWSKNLEQWERGKA